MRQNLALLVDQPHKDATVPNLNIADVEFPRLEENSVLVRMLLRPINPSGVSPYTSRNQKMNSLHIDFKTASRVKGRLGTEMA
jgi:hypothetical protein